VEQQNQEDESSVREAEDDFALLLMVDFLLGHSQGHCR
jgi:hypothetical protein